MLLGMDSLCGEPVCMWLSEAFRTLGASIYVPGGEVKTDYDGAVPEGFDTITPPAADYLMFQGAPFAEEGYRDAVPAVQRAMKQKGFC